MTKEEIVKIILASPTLPTLPTVASKLISVSLKEETGINDITYLISQDASLSAKTLKIANSAFYNLPCKVSTIHQAVLRLGINVVRSLVLSVSFLSIKVRNKKDAFNYERFWEQSLSNAVATKLIMTEISKSDWEEFFVIGLLQNIGEMLIALSFPQQYEEILLEASRGEKDLIEVEQQILGTDHAYIGYAVAKHWGFPPVLTEPIQYHHCPEGYTGNNKKSKLAIAVVHLAEIITNIIYANNPQKYHQKFLAESRAMLDFSDKTIDKILGQVASEIMQTAILFDLYIKNPKPIEEILQEANAALSTMTITYDQINRELATSRKELEEKNKRLESIVHLDSLTEVFNHGYFQGFLEREINLADRKNTTLCLILADIDNFKNINDKYGHQVGDFILKEFCRVMKLSLRNYDLLARYGGEEFAIVLVDTTGQAAVTVAENLRESIELHAFIYNNKVYHITASFGIAEMRPAVDIFMKNDLINFADKALFESKKKGRNRVTLYAKKNKSSC